MTDATLVLDIDGVVSLAHPGSARPWYTGMKEALGLEPEHMQLHFFRTPVFLEVLRGRQDLRVAMNDYLEPLGLADRMDELIAWWFAQDSVLDREVLRLADAWRLRTGGRVFAATNQEHHRSAYLRDTAGLSAHFDEIVYSAALGVCKPDRVFYSNAQMRMKVANVRSILFVDDTAANVDGARACGWQAMLYRGRDSLAAALDRWG